MKTKPAAKAKAVDAKSVFSATDRKKLLSDVQKQIKDLEKQVKGMVKSVQTDVIAKIKKQLGMK